MSDIFAVNEGKLFSSNLTYRRANENWACCNKLRISEIHRDGERPLLSLSQTFNILESVTDNNKFSDLIA